jgi:hypothetical protein
MGARQESPENCAEIVQIESVTMKANWKKRKSNWMRFLVYIILHLNVAKPVGIDWGECSSLRPRMRNTTPRDMSP